MISPIIDKRLYLTLFDSATTSWVLTLTWKNTTWIFSDFFKASLTTLFTHGIIEFSKTLISNHFLLGLRISKKKYQDVSLCKKVSALKKNTSFPIATQKSTQNQKLTLKMCFWGSSATSILNFIFFFEKLRIFNLRHVISDFTEFRSNFQIQIQISEKADFSRRDFSSKLIWNFSFLNVQ